MLVADPIWINEEIARWDRTKVCILDPFLEDTPECTQPVQRALGKPERGTPAW